MNSPIKCVIHCRVSTGKQAYEGESLQVQEDICRGIAERNRWNLAHAPWLEAYTGRKSVRPAFGEVLAFLDAHPGQVRYYVFRAIDRFTRGGTAMYEQMKHELARRGVELVDSMGVIQPARNTLEDVGFEYEWSKVSPSEVAEAVLATTAKAEATTILTRLIGQEIRLTQRGFKIRASVDGYRNERIYVDGKRRVIQVPDPERAKYYIAMFELRAAAQLTDSEIVARVNAMGFRSAIKRRWDETHQRVVRHVGGEPLSVKRFQEIIKRPIYCGVMREKWTNWQPIKAAYEGLVSIETWNAANRGKVHLRQTANGLETIVGSTRTLRAKNNPLYPFRRVVLCPLCRKPFLGSASRSRTGQHIPAYHCAREHARVSRGKVAFEKAIRNFVSGLRFEPPVLAIVSEALLQQYERRMDECRSSVRDMRASAAQLEAAKVSTARAFREATSDVMRRVLETEIERLEMEIHEASTRQDEVDVGADDVCGYARDLGDIMEHPGILVEEQANTEARQARFGLAFDGLPTLTEIESGTAKLSPIVRICKGENDPQSALVRLAGLTWNQIEAEIHRWKMEAARK